MYVVGCYFVYLALSLGVTIWVAHTLHKNGRVFLVDAFHGNETMADSINHLLVVGFYLVNIGYVTLALKSDSAVLNLQQSIEMVSSKLGIVLVVLGVMHFGNLYVFSRLRHRTKHSLPIAPPPAPWPQN